MSIFALLTQFDGRIGRVKFWLSIVPLFLLGMAIALGVLYLQVGAQLWEPEFSASLEGLQASTLGALAGTLVTLLPYLAVSIKRLHDRGRSGWFMLVFIVPNLALMLSDYLGLGGAPMERTLLGNVLQILNISMLIWYFVDLGLLRGESGPNVYGPDPRSSDIQS